MCINYDKAYFAENNLPCRKALKISQSLNIKVCWWLKTLLPHPQAWHFCWQRSRIMAILFTDYWQALKENDVVVVDGWETAYYTNFSGSSGHGPQPMVVSYGTSPAAEVIFAEKPLDDAPTASILGPDTCFRQIEFVGILKGTAAARPRRKICRLHARANNSRRMCPCKCLSIL